MPEQVETHETLDVRGLLCPMPLLKAQAAVSRLQPGQTLKILTDESSDEIELRAWAERSGHNIIQINRIERTTEIYLVKRQ